MGLQEVAIWYQRKIGTYDKQPWERTVEQRILHGLTHVPRKSAKLTPQLIDVDLVRGGHLGVDQLQLVLSLIKIDDLFSVSFQALLSRKPSPSMGSSQSLALASYDSY